MFVKYRANAAPVGARHVNSPGLTNRPSRPCIRLLAHATPQDDIKGKLNRRLETWRSQTHLAKKLALK